MIDQTELLHYGVKGQKWGVRRDNPDKVTHRMRLEADYLTRGFSKEEATRLADRKLKVQKTLAISAGVVAVAAASYLTYRAIGKEFVGVKIKEGTTLQHLSKSDKLGLGEKHLYTTFKKGDKFNYQGTFAAEMGGLGNVQIHKINLKASKDIVAPSNFQGKKIFEETLGHKVSQKSYREFINSFYKVNQDNNKKYQAFKENMLKKGFNAVIDTTDQNAYAKAYKPTIVFASSSNLSELGSRALNKTEVANKLMVTRLAQSLKSPTFAAYSSIGAGIVGIKKAANHKEESDWISEYRKKNPGTAKSTVEILEEYYSEGWAE